MVNILKSKTTFRFIIITLLLFLFIPNYSSVADSKHWDTNWSYYQEIEIPFDTSLEIARFQPIDIKVEFQNPCWAKNDLEHSIRIVCWDGKNWRELESQIYSLENSKENFLSSCNIVFLIPSFADGTEQYYIYYDDSEKHDPNYIDHVKIEDLYYRYEPISGYPLESYYYKITDDGYVPYAVSYQGELMGYNTCQHVTKLKDQSVEVLPKNGEVFAAFDFKYAYEKSLFGYSSTSQKVVSKEILVDGNLMLEFRITSVSKFNDLHTTATYKYYHCPSTNIRIHAHVKHESLKEITVVSIPPATNSDGVFASLQGGGVKCKSIEELNIGEILPFMHLYNERDTISEYKIDIDPPYIAEGDPDIRIISYQDDVDLGKNPWFSFDEGETGVCHSVIFNKNSVLVSGTDEKDGLQLNVFEVDYPHMLGFENNVATIQVGRNSFEAGGSHDLVIPDDFVVEFDAEFFTSYTNGFSIVDEEGAIFRKLVEIKPLSKDDTIQDSEEIKIHNLSVFVHFAPSVPMGSSLSALLGINFSYISAELYKDDNFIYSENAVRLPMNPLPELEELSFFKKIIESLKIFDLKNISIFKKAEFLGIDEGRYVIKIFKENPIFSKEKQYIGYAIVDLKNDEKIHISCGSEASVKVKVVDQNNIPLKNAEVTLQKEGTNIARLFTDEKGQVTIKAPTSAKNCKLNIIYNGIVIHQEQVNLGFFQRIIPAEKKFVIELHNLKLKVRDKWGQVPGVDLNPMISIKELEDPLDISGHRIDNDEFIFKNLTPNIYTLSFTFKSFNLKKDVEISEDKELILEFPAEYDVKFRVMDEKGLGLKNSKIEIIRNNEKLIVDNQDSETVVTIPPGSYKVKVYSDSDLIGKRDILIYGEQNYDLITNYQPSYPAIIFIIGILLIILSMILAYYKRNIKYFYKIIIISLVLISVFLPWWEINGSTDYLNTSTQLFILPNNMITMYATENTIAGELSFLPEEFKLAMFLIVISICGGCFLLLFEEFLRKKEKITLFKMSNIFSKLAFVGSLAIFIFAMNELSKVTVGGIIGNGYLDIGVPGESQINSIFCSWGPSIGLYLYIIAVVFLLLVFSIKYYTDKDERLMSGKNKQNIQHPLFGISIRNWFMLLEKNKGVDLKYFTRGAFITFGSIFSAPARLLFKIRYEKEINNLKIKEPPVIIIGHWRSGTTYLHELLSKDTQFCYVSLWNTLLPDSFLVLNPMKKFLANFLPKKRPMDEIKVDIDGPYEEEAAVAVISPWSFFHCLHFAKNAEEQYLKSIHYKGLSDEEKKEWDDKYLKFMKTVIYSNDGKRLLLKNPANTARIPTLLKLFPDARFIHIYRSPYKVYFSTVKMRNRVLDKLALQNVKKEEIEKQVIENYIRVMNSYFEQVKLIPKERIVDVKYEDLVKDPIKEVSKIYSKLKIPGLKKALPGMNKYLDSKKDYKVNVYKIDEKIIKHIYDKWKFTIDKWGYKPPK